MCKHFYFECKNQKTRQCRNAMRELVYFPSIGGTAVVVWLRDEPCDSYDKKTRKCKEGKKENILDPDKVGDSCYLCKHQGPATEENLQQQRSGSQAIHGPEARNERMKAMWDASMRKAKEELAREEAQLATHNQRQAAAREADRAMKESNICKSAVDDSQRGGINEKLSRKQEDSEEESEEVLKAVWDDTVRKAFHAAGRGRAYDHYHEIERQQSTLTQRASDMQIHETGSLVNYNTPNPIPAPSNHPTSFSITKRTPSPTERPKRRRATNNSSSSASSSRQNSL